MQIQNSPYLSAGKINTQYGSRILNSAGENTTANALSFKEILQSRENESTSQVKFSKHAANRLNDRNIELTQDQMDRLNQAAAQAGEKGINESLILVDQLAFIVNVPNNTVVTAMDQKDKSNQIFTNIDGAVIA